MPHTTPPFFLSPTGRYLRYDGVHGPNICDFDVFGGPEEEDRANKRLFLAAPAMLEALVYVADMLAQPVRERAESPVTITLAERIGAIGGYRAERLVKDALAAVRGEPKPSTPSASSSDWTRGGCG